MFVVNDDIDRPSSPCESLWRDVVVTAIKDLNMRRAGEHAGAANVYREQAERWFKSGSMEPGSFLWICDHMEINAEILIKNLKKRGLIK